LLEADSENAVWHLFCRLFNTAVSVARSCSTESYNEKIRGRSDYSLFQDMPALAGRTEEKHECSVRTACATTEILSTYYSVMKRR
jgi:hypothetical protein